MSTATVTDSDVLTDLDFDTVLACEIRMVGSTARCERPAEFLLTIKCPVCAGVTHLTTCAVHDSQTFRYTADCGTCHHTMRPLRAHIVERTPLP